MKRTDLIALAERVEHKYWQAAAILARMVRYGYVSDAFSKYRITSKGLAQLPRVVAAPTMRPYVPPKVIRRAGSDVAGRLPSVFAGQRVERT